MSYQKYYKSKALNRQNNKPMEEGKTINLQESEKVDKYIFVLQIVALILIPLFVKARMNEFISPDFTMVDTGYKVDVFSYYKYIFLVIITIIMSMLFLYKVAFLGFELKNDKIALFTGLIAILIVISTVASPYKSIALHGTYNRFEGAITYICYLMQFYIAANTQYTSKRLNWLILSISPFVILNFIIGLSLFLGHDIFDIKWVNKLIMASVSGTGQLQAGTLWSTLSNPNYISGISSVLTVLFLTWAILDKNKLMSILNVVISTITFVIVLTSFSTSGFLTILVLLPIIVILIFFNEQKVKSFVILITFIILASSVFVPLVNKNPRVWDESFGFIFKENPFANEQTSLININKYEVEKGIKDVFLPSRAFAENNNETANKFEIPTLPESGFSAGSGRTYIWEKTIEIAMDRPLIGYGFDTYSFVFPQNDINKISGLGTYDIIVDKPHNMYFGILIGSGTIALISFILLLGSVLFNSIKTIWKRRTPQPKSPAMLALFTASIAYLVQGMFNDSVIGAAVIFWILFGVLVSIIYQTQTIASGKEE